MNLLETNEFQITTATSMQTLHDVLKVTQHIIKLSPCCILSEYIFIKPKGTLVCWFSILPGPS